MNGEINANEAGLRTKRECTDYDLYVLWRKHQQNEHGQSVLLRFGTLSDSAISDDSNSDNRSGGIIAIRSLSDITNSGVLSSNGSVIDGQYEGGSICLLQMVSSQITVKS